ncbi:hypothetical protein [Nonomuraea sp. NPDC049480]|uniref:hypothetical protein n=1 Tax=Nonomuraea sp. NPDC049480 TaxID=3364353 RepID=UPI0037894052
MSRKPALADRQIARTATARVLLRGGVEEKTGEVLSARVVAERVGWGAGLAAGMAAGLLAERWNPGDVAVLADGLDGAGRRLPSKACAPPPCTRSAQAPPPPDADIGREGRHWARASTCTPTPPRHGGNTSPGRNHNRTQDRLADQRR